MLGQVAFVLYRTREILLLNSSPFWFAAVVIGIIANPCIAMARNVATDAWRACKSSNTEDQLRGCTTIINAKGFGSASRLAEALDGRCWAYHAKGQFSLAVEDCKASIALRPRYSYAYNNLGTAYLGLTEYESALAAFDKAIELKPDFFWSRLNRARTYVALGKVNDAINDYEYLLARDPSNKEVANALRELRSSGSSPTPHSPPTTSEQPAPTESYSTTGTGFVVTTDGYVLTNRHVVDNCGSVTVHHRGAAVIKEVDETNDLALLKMQGSTVAATFRSTSPDLGEAVYALGFPYSGVLGPGVNFTGGLISSLSGIGNDSRYLQFSAAVQPGNSGGPLVDANGLIVGVVSARLADIEMLKASGSLPQNVNFAIRGDLAAGFLRANGIAPVVVEPKSPLSTSSIASHAQAYTVQVVCQPGS